MSYYKLLRSIVRIILYRLVFFSQFCDNGRARCGFRCDAMANVDTTLGREQSMLSILKCARD
jgi:hypothetical protein